MRRRILHKYIIAFASFFIVPLIILSFCLQVVMFDNLEEDIISYNQNILERLGDDFESINSRLMESGNTVSFSDAILSDLGKSSNQADMIRILMEENMNNPYTSKLYLIYNEGEYSFSSSGKYSLEDMFQKKMSLNEEDKTQFLNTVKSQEKAQYRMINKTYVLGDKVTTKKQLVYIYPVQNYVKNLKSWIIMEVNSIKLENRFTIAPGNYSKGLFMLNSDGELILSEMDQFDLSIYKSQITKAVAEGNMVLDIGNGNEKILFNKLDKVNLILGNVITTPNLYANVIEENRTLVKGLLVFLVLGCTFAIYMAYRYYKPIRQLSVYMSQENEVNSNTDEFTYMKKQYDRVNEVKMKIAEELEQQWPMVEEHLVRQILYDGNLQENQSDMVNSMVMRQMQQQAFTVFILKYKNEEENELYEVYKSSDTKIKQELSEEFQIYSAFIYYYDVIAVILGGDSARLKESKERLNFRLKELVEAETMEIAISSGNVYEGIAGIHISFLESMANLQYEGQNNEKEYFGYTSEEEADEYKKQVITYQIENLLLIKGCIDGGNINEVSEIVRKVVLNMEELPGYMELMCCYDIINQLIKELPKLHVTVSSSEVFSMANFKTTEEFGTNLEMILKLICKNVIEIKQDKQDDLMQMISNYIDNNFTDPNLSLVALADEFHFSPSYVSKFIGQNFSESFTDIVTRKRVEYTKECLVHTNNQISQIAREAGYLNISNFTRRFKNFENMTPGQYRMLYGTIKMDTEKDTER